MMRMFTEVSVSFGRPGLSKSKHVLLGLAKDTNS